MKILLCSDLSNKIPRIPSEIIESSDFVLVAGDITIGARSLKRTISVFEKLSILFPDPLPVFLIPGNHDLPIVAGNPDFFPKNIVKGLSSISPSSIGPNLESTTLFTTSK